MVVARDIDPGIDSDLMMMWLADARLPTGAHTQSAGLEAALNAGLAVARIPDYIDARLATVVAVEAGAAVVARRYACAETAAPASLAGRLTNVETAWRVRTMSPALRETSALLGRGYLRLLGRLWPESTAVQALSMVARPGRAVVLGVAAACCGLSAGRLARIIGYDDAQTIAAAALKLCPLDPVDVSRWSIIAAPAIASMADRVTDLSDPADIPAAAAPLIEQWAQVHATTAQRLFRG